MKRDWFDLRKYPANGRPFAILPVQNNLGSCFVPRQSACYPEARLDPCGAPRVTLGIIRTNGCAIDFCVRVTAELFEPHILDCSSLQDPLELDLTLVRGTSPIGVILHSFIAP